MKTSEKHITGKVILLHSIFWILWIVTFTVIQSIGKESHIWLVWLMYYLITLPIFVTHTYLIAYWLLPAYFFKNRFLLFTVGIFALLIIFSIVELIVSNYLVFKIFAPEIQFGHGYLNLKNIFVSGVGNHYIILIFLAIKAGKSWYTAKAEKENLIRQNTETEVEIFRRQFQPGIVLELINELEKTSESEPEKTPDLIIRISEFMNQLLLTENTDLLPVSSELTLIEHYLEVQKVILGERLKTHIALAGDLSTWFIPPLSTLPFLNHLGRNATDNKQDYEVNVVIKAERKYLLFSMTIWSENDFPVSMENLSDVFSTRINYYFPGKHRIIENIDPNFRELALEIYYEKM